MFPITTLTLRRCALALALSTCGVLAQASSGPVSFHATIDSSTMTGGGYLDFALIPGQVPATGATVTLSNFSGAFGSSFELSGDASGTLASAFTLGNTMAYNDLFHSVTLGGTFGFDVTFGGDYATSAGNIGTTFGVGLLAADQVTYLGNANGNLFQMELTPMQGELPGTVDVSVLAGDVASIAAVPEPSEYLMMLAGLGILGALVRRRRQSAA